MNVKNNIALVTGGSSGIGEAIALRFAREGAKIVISYKENREGADRVISEIQKEGVEALAIQANLTKDEDAKHLVEETIKQYGRLDILVNNAGRYINGDEWDGTSDVWEESLKQNLISTLSVSKYALETMQKQKSGVIVNIASRYSIAGQYDAIAYAAAKAGVVNITEGQAKLMAPWGRSNAVSPGNVRAGYWLTAPKEELDENIAATPLGKLIEPEDIAEAVLFLASDRAKMITSQNILVDGGYTLR